MWVVYALLAAVFAAVTSILARLGMAGLNTSVVVAIRTAVVLVMAWAMVFITGNAAGIREIANRNWIFLVLSGLATGASWFFFFRALSIGEVGRVAAIDKFSVVLTIVFAFLFLGEALSPKVIVGAVLITAGTLLMIF